MTLVEDLRQDIRTFLNAESTAAPLLKRILLFLEDGEFVQADSYCEKVLDLDPENPVAYLGKLMASRRISSLQELADAQYTVDDDSSFKKAIRFAPEEMQQHLQALNMRIYGNCITACRNRARIHMSHGELKETAQQYHNAMKLWEGSKDTLPNAQAVYNDLANEVADFNWKLMLHNRQCPDDQQLIARGIPIDTDRWYLSAVKWADDEKKAQFASVAEKTLFTTHLKCMDAIQAGQTKLAGIWADHYKASASADDPLSVIHQALVPTKGFTEFVADAPAALLKLIELYAQRRPHAVDDLKTILQAYYQKIFQSTLDFSGQPQPMQTAVSGISNDAYNQQICQKESLACDGEKVAPSPIETPPTETAVTDSAWAMETARRITSQMAEAVSSGLSPYGQISTYLVPAKELTVRYGRKDGIVTSFDLFAFICSYYQDAISCAQAEQAVAIQEKFNEFLIDTVRLPSASAEIASHASACMQDSPLPYQIYLSRLTNDYSVEKEALIPAELVEELAQWHRLSEAANPKKDAYWISDRQEEITASFTSVEKAISVCKRYPAALQSELEATYQKVLENAGENSQELISGWSEKMQTLQVSCDSWADSLQQSLTQVKQVYSEKLQIAKKRIKQKEALQLTGSIIGILALIATIVLSAIPLIGAVGYGFSLIKAPNAAPGYDPLLFYGINIGLPVIAGAFSLVNGWAARAYQNSRCRKLVWLFALMGIIIYTGTGAVASKALLDLTFTLKMYILAGVLASGGIFRSLLEFIFAKLASNTRSRPAKACCNAGTAIAWIAYLAQALVCFFVAGLFLYTLIIG